MNPNDYVADAVAGSLKIMPATTVVGATIMGFTLQETVSILAGSLILFQFAYGIWKWRSEYLAKKAFREKIEAPVE